MNIIRSLNNCTDTDCLSAKNLTDAMPSVGNFYTCIINKSIREGIFPKCWKESVVRPVPKIPKSLRPEQFRPINNMMTSEKPLERIVKDQLVEYIETNNILSNCQSGYRHGFSCESALNVVIQSWIGHMDGGEIVLACFLDMKRAFETINRTILMDKLKNIGVAPQSLKWFQSYLQDRIQTTKIDKEFSSKIDIDIGVPQGSILGAFLFIIYINDMETVHVGLLQDQHVC